MLLLIGLPFSGKSTLGKRLAEEKEVPFIDTDRLIEEKTGKSCRALFKESETRFREEERHILQALEPMKAVVALGGGAILHRELYPHLQSLGTIIYLYEEPLTLFKRILKGEPPATLKPENLLESWMELLEKRQLLYHYLADLTIYGEQQFWHTFSNHHLRGVSRPCSGCGD